MGDALSFLFRDVARRLRSSIGAHELSLGAPDMIAPAAMVDLHVVDE